MKITFTVNDSYYANPIDDLELTERASNCLHRASIHTVGDLIQHIEDETLSDIRGLGKKVEREIKNALFNYALCNSKDVVKFLLDVKVA